MNRKFNRIAPVARRAALAATVALGALGVGVAQAQVSVAVGVNAPGVYGQINIGGMPTPELLMPQAVVAVPPRVVVGVPPPAPLYLHVPAGYERHWRQHCREYHACGRPVYFVSENWYHNVYVPHRARPHGPVVHRGGPRPGVQHRDPHDNHDHGHDDHDHDHR